MFNILFNIFSDKGMIFFFLYSAFHQIKSTKKRKNTQKSRIAYKIWANFKAKDGCNGLYEGNDRDRRELYYKGQNFTLEDGAIRLKNESGYAGLAIQVWLDIHKDHTQKEGKSIY